jgi:hypothetical protein
LGFAVRGLLYIVIGSLVIGAGRNEDPSGALEYLVGGAGRTLLVVMAVGLVAYGVWRLTDAALDIERHGGGRKGAFERLGAGLSGVTHLLLAWQAVRLLRGLRASGDRTQEGAQTALEMPGGEFVIILAGVILAVLGAVQLIKAWKGNFLRYLEPQIASQAWARWSGRVGYAARGIVFVITGYLLALAGTHERASEAGGMSRALAWLTSPTDVIIAAGLFCFGIYSLVEARYRVLQDVPIDHVAQRVTGKR